MLLDNILAGFVLSAAFPIGYLLYLWSKEEVDWVLDKYKYLKNLEKIILPFAIISGLLAGFFVKNTEMLLVLFFVNLLIASITIKKWKQIALPKVLFLVAFLILYFAINFLHLI